MRLYEYFDQSDSADILNTLRQWKHDSPDGVCLALLAESDRESIPSIQKLFKELNYPLIGAMFPELIIDAEFKRSGVLLMQIDTQPYFQLIPELACNEQTLDEIISAFATDLQQHLDNNAHDSALMLIFDGMLPNIGTILERLYLNLSNQVHYFGVNAGSETFQPMPCLFDSDNIIGNGMLAVLLANHPGAILAHNYRQPETEITATSTDNNRISSIDWKPAFEAYQELVKKQYDVDITAENFYEYGVHFPFGINRMDGEPLVRIPVALQDDGSLFCVGEVPPNTMLSLLNAIPTDSHDSVDAITRKIQLHADQGMMNFYCAGRRMHMGDAASHELRELKTRLVGKQIIGALSLGEIGSSIAGGYPLFHNASLVAAPW